jgi:hypothetical protein
MPAGAAEAASKTLRDDNGIGPDIEGQASAPVRRATKDESSAGLQSFSGEGMRGKVNGAAAAMGVTTGIDEHDATRLIPQ